MLAFTTNSVPTRQALSDAFIDPLADTGIRLASGAAVLMCAAWWQSSGNLARQGPHSGR